MSRWLLCDYGEVLCVAPPGPDWEVLVGLALDSGWDPPDRGRASEAFKPVFWEHRRAYDRGDLSAPEYWTATLGRRPGAADLGALVAADQAIWLHPNPDSLRAATRAGQRGWRLAILSNAPLEVAAHIDRLPWLSGFGPRLFSCHLNLVKPEPAIYRAALDSLGAAPHEVVFFDDRPANVEAALELGIDARLFTHPEQLDLAG